MFSAGPEVSPHSCMLPKGVLAMHHHCCSGNGNSRPSSHDSTAGAHSNGFVIQCLPLAIPSKPTVRQICRIEAGNTPSKRSNTSREAASPTPNGPPRCLKYAPISSSTQPGSLRSSSMTTHYRPVSTPEKKPRRLFSSAQSNSRGGSWRREARGGSASLGRPAEKVLVSVSPDGAPWGTLYKLP